MNNNRMIEVLIVANENVSLEQAINELLQSAIQKDLIVEFLLNERDLTRTEQAIIDMM